MKKLIIPLLALCLVPFTARADIRINEVHFNVEGPDGNYEFIELKSTTNTVERCERMSLVIINNALSDDGVVLNPGEILEVLSLDELSTGTNGLLLLGNGYTGSPPGGPWSGAIDPATAIADPAGLGNADIKTNTGLTLLLVRNYKTDVAAQAALADPFGIIDIDKDPNVLGGAAISTGNGVIDWVQSPPPAGAVPPLWENADVVDSIGTQDYIDTDDAVDANAKGTRTPYVPTTANINITSASFTLGLRDPDTFARQLGNNTATNAASYYGGKMNNSNPTPTDILYRTNRTFGPGNMLGQVTPGRANLATTLPATDFRINEVILNPSGSNPEDDRFQCVEIINNDGQSRSLSGYWLILLDSYNEPDPKDPLNLVGNILEEWNLSDFATGSNGLLLLGDGFSPTHTPFQDAVSPQTAVGDPSAKTGPPASSGWGLGDLGDKEGFTLLLVKGYSPPLNRDLDRNPQDGSLDSAAWTSLSDQIGFSQIGNNPIGRTYSGVDLRSVFAPTMLQPDSFARKPGNLANNSTSGAAAWYGGSFPGSSSPMTLGFEPSTSPLNYNDPSSATWFGGFRGAATPGRPNLGAPVNPVSPPIPASVRINEVMFDPNNFTAGGGDEANEYVELVSTTEGIAYLDGLYLVVVDMENGKLGNIKTGSPLSGYTTGTNRLALLGDGYDNNAGRYDTNTETLPPGSAAFDPIVGFEGDDLPNDGIAILLVRGVKGPIMVADADGKLSGTLDADNDGVLPPASDYTDELVDSIVVSSRNPGPGYGWIDSNSFMPDHAARYPGNLTASNAISWYYGQIQQLPFLIPPPTNYSGSFSGAFQGAASPGRANHAATPGPVNVGDVLFNEINFNPAGADKNFEFIEVLSKNGAARSLNGYSILAIDNQISNTGAIRHAWSLDGMATGSNGLFMMGNGYPTGQNPWQSVMRTQTRTGDPAGREGLDSSFSDEVLGRETDDLNIAFVLVRNFSGYINFDLDAKTNTPPNPLPNPDPMSGYDSPGDGVLDGHVDSNFPIPWNEGLAGVHDSVLLRDFVPTVPAPAIPVAPYPYDGWTYGLDDLTAVFFPTPFEFHYHPETIARFRGENGTNDATAWYGGDLFGGVSRSDGNAEEYVTKAQDPLHKPLPYLPEPGFWGRVTPGQPNLTRESGADADLDGTGNLMESAINSDPFSDASVGPVPLATRVSDGGQEYLGFSYTRIRSPLSVPPVPFAAEAYTYVVETSPDLQTWTPDGSGGNAPLVQVGTPVPNADGVTETVTLRLPTPVTSTVRQYVRLRVGRR